MAKMRDANSRKGDSARPMPGKQPLRSKLPGVWRVLKYFWPHVCQFRWLMAGALCALFVEVVMGLFEPWPLKFVLDYIIGTKHSARTSLPHFLTTLSPFTLLSLAALAVIILSGGKALGAYWETVGFTLIGNRALARLRNQLYRHVQFLSLSFHTRARTGDIVVRMMADVITLQEVAVTAVMPTMTKSLITAGMLGLMFWMNWRLALVATAVLPIFWLRCVTLGRRIREAAQRQRRREGEIAAKFSESLNAIKTVHALSLEESFARAFSIQAESSLRQDAEGRRLSAALERSLDALIAVATALVLWFGTRLALHSQLTAGELIVFLAYLRAAYRPVQDFAKYAGRLARAAAAGERVIDLLERVPDVYDLPNAAPAPTLTGRVQFDGVSFAYERGQRLLEDIRFEIQPGQHVALVGPSGGGKSTLVSLILRLYDPLRGRVLMDGRNIRDFTLESLRTQIGVVLQDNVLFAVSVRENIACAAPGATFEEVQTAARIANADEFIRALPHGYDSILGERGATLSHGQRQRVAIARAAIRQAPVLILDEPTTGLDKKSECAVLEALERLYHSRTTFHVTHELWQARSADVILYLEAGHVRERGTHDELMQLNGRYAALFRAQAGLRAVAERPAAVAS